MRRGSLKGKNEENQSNMLEKYSKRKLLLYISQAVRMLRKRDDWEQAMLQMKEAVRNE